MDDFFFTGGSPQLFQEGVDNSSNNYAFHDGNANATILHTRGPFSVFTSTAQYNFGHGSRCTFSSRILVPESLTLIAHSFRSSNMNPFPSYSGTRGLNLTTRGPAVHATDSTSAFSTRDGVFDTFDESPAPASTLAEARLPSNPLVGGPAMDSSGQEEQFPSENEIVDSGNDMGQPRGGATLGNSDTKLMKTGDL